MKATALLLSFPLLGLGSNVFDRSPANVKRALPSDAAASVCYTYTTTYLTTAGVAQPSITALPTGTGTAPPGNGFIILSVSAPPASPTALGLAKRQEDPSSLAIGSGYVSEGEVTASCASAISFELFNGVLTRLNTFTQVSVDAGVSIAPLDNTTGSISTYFSIVGNVLVWQNSLFPQGYATFCELDSFIYTTFAADTQPIGCTPVSLVVIQADQCPNVSSTPSITGPTPLSSIATATGLSPPVATEAPINIFGGQTFVISLTQYLINQGDRILSFATSPSVSWITFGLLPSGRTDYSTLTGQVPSEASIGQSITVQVTVQGASGQPYIVQIVLVVSQPNPSASPVIPPVSNPTAGNPTAGNPTAGNPTAGNPTAGNPTAGNPTAGNPTAGNPTAGNPSAGNPTAGNPTAGNPTAGNPTAGNPSAGNPTAGNPTAGNPTAGNPTGSNPTANSPSPVSSSPPSASTTDTGGQPILATIIVRPGESTQVDTEPLLQNPGLDIPVGFTTDPAVDWVTLNPNGRNIFGVLVPNNYPSGIVTVTETLRTPSGSLYNVTFALVVDASISATTNPTGANSGSPTPATTGPGTGPTSTSASTFNAPSLALTPGEPFSIGLIGLVSGQFGVGGQIVPGSLQITPESAASWAGLQNINGVLALTGTVPLNTPAGTVTVSYQYQTSGGAIIDVILPLVVSGSSATTTPLQPSSTTTPFDPVITTLVLSQGQSFTYPLSQAVQDEYGFIVQSTSGAPSWFDIQAILPPGEIIPLLTGSGTVPSTQAPGLYTVVVSAVDSKGNSVSLVLQIQVTGQAAASTPAASPPVTLTSSPAATTTPAQPIVLDTVYLNPGQTFQFSPSQIVSELTGEQLTGVTTLTGQTWLQVSSTPTGGTPGGAIYSVSGTVPLNEPSETVVLQLTTVDANGNTNTYYINLLIQPAATSSPAAPTSNPEAPTSSPEAPTSSPAAPTSNPEAPTSSPAAPTSSPEAPTSSPAAPTSSPVAPTSSPEASTSSLLAPSNSPEAPTSSPAAPTSSPVAPTSSPEASTSSPVAPSNSPAAPTSSPEAPTSSLLAPSNSPAAPTSSPVAPTSSPEASTSSPVAPSNSPAAPTSSPEAPTSSLLAPSNSPAAPTSSLVAPSSTPNSLPTVFTVAAGQVLNVDLIPYLANPSDVLGTPSVSQGNFISLSPGDVLTLAPPASQTPGIVTITIPVTPQNGAPYQLQLTVNVASPSSTPSIVSSTRSPIPSSTQANLPSSITVYPGDTRSVNIGPYLETPTDILGQISVSQGDFISLTASGELTISPPLAQAPTSVTVSIPVTGTNGGTYQLPFTIIVPALPTVAPLPVITVSPGGNLFSPLVPYLQSPTDSIIGTLGTLPDWVQIGINQAANGITIAPPLTVAPGTYTFGIVASGPNGSYVLPVTIVISAPTSSSASPNSPSTSAAPQPSAAGSCVVPPAGSPFIATCTFVQGLPFNDNLLPFITPSGAIIAGIEDNALGWLSSSSTGIQGTPPLGASSPVIITLVVVDPFTGAESLEQVQVVIVSGVQPASSSASPSASPTPIFTEPANTPFTIDGTQLLQNANDQVQFGASTAPGVTYNPLTGNFEGTVASPGTYGLTLTVTSAITGQTYTINAGLSVVAVASPTTSSITSAIPRATPVFTEPANTPFEIEATTLLQNPNDEIQGGSSSAVGVTFNPLTGVFVGTIATPGTYDLSVTAISSVTGQTYTVNAGLVVVAGASPTSSSVFVAPPSSTSTVAVPVFNEIVNTFFTIEANQLLRNPDDELLGGISTAPGVSYNSATGVFEGAVGALGTYGLTITAISSVTGQTYTVNAGLVIITAPLATTSSAFVAPPSSTSAAPTSVFTEIVNSPFIIDATQLLQNADDQIEGGTSTAVGVAYDASTETFIGTIGALGTYGLTITAISSVTGQTYTVNAGLAVISGVLATSSTANVPASSSTSPSPTAAFTEFVNTPFVLDPSPLLLNPDDELIGGSTTAPGVIFDGAGTFSGTVTAAGTYGLTITAVSSLTNQIYTINAGLVITVIPVATTSSAFVSLPSTSTSASPTAEFTEFVNTPFILDPSSLLQNPNDNLYGGSITAPGVTFDAAGTFSGTVTAGGVYQLTINAQSSTTGQIYQVTANLYIVPAPSATTSSPFVALPSSSIPAATPVFTEFVNTPFVIDATTLLRNVNDEITGSTTAPGVVFLPTGTFSGSCPIAGNYGLVITAISSVTGQPYTVNAGLSIIANVVQTTSTIPNAISSSTAPSPTPVYTEFVNLPFIIDPIALLQNPTDEIQSGISTAPGIVYDSAAGVFDGTCTTVGNYGLSITAISSVTGQTYTVNAGLAIVANVVQTTSTIPNAIGSSAAPSSAPTPIYTEVINTPFTITPSGLLQNPTDLIQSGVSTAPGVVFDSTAGVFEGTCPTVGNYGLIITAVSSTTGQIYTVNAGLAIVAATVPVAASSSSVVPSSVTAAPTASFTQPVDTPFVIQADLLLQNAGDQILSGSTTAPDVVFDLVDGTFIGTVPTIGTYGLVITAISSVTGLTYTVNAGLSVIAVVASSTVPISATSSTAPSSVSAAPIPTFTETVDTLFSIPATLVLQNAGDEIQSVSSTTLDVVYEAGVFVGTVSTIGTYGLSITAISSITGQTYVVNAAIVVIASTASTTPIGGQPATSTVASLPSTTPIGGQPATSTVASLPSTTPVTVQPPLATIVAGAAYDISLAAYLSPGDIVQSISITSTGAAYLGLGSANDLSGTAPVTAALGVQSVTVSVLRADGTNSLVTIPFVVVQGAAQAATTTTTTTTAGPTPTPTPSAPTGFNCSTLGFLIQGTLFYEVDLSEAFPYLQNPLTDGPFYIDAIGYNIQDNFVYGLAQSGFGAGDLIRIGQGGRSQLVKAGVAPSILAGTVTAFLAGDVDNNGIYWACTTTTGTNGQIYIGVDLKPGSATYGQVIFSGKTTLPYPIFDWAYVPGGGNFLYALGQVPPVVFPPASAKTALLRFSLTTFTWSTVKASFTFPLPPFNTPVSFIGTNTWGAVYASSTGNLYALEATTGSTYKFPVVGTSTTATYFSQFLPQGTIDGARCYNAPDPLPFF